jgi:serine/threonine protein kinase
MKSSWNWKTKRCNVAKIPSKIGKYPIESKIAEGGMGAVYKGTHPTLNRPVILKRLTLKNSDHLTERFRREARMMMNFKNENIVNFYDHFKAGDSYYIVLEYIDGSDLNHMLTKERYLDCDMALYIFRESCKALKYAHKHQVIHRDIKPANIMFNSSGEVKLVDFGVAHEGSEEEAGLTTDGMTVGTPSYMAPEQFQDSRSVDNRADIYSMGVMLYQMVTGKKPFAGGYSPELIASIQKNKYVKPVKINPDINKTTQRIIKKCMRASAAKRYSDMDQILTILDKYFRNVNETALVDELKARVAGDEIPERKKKKIPRGKVFFWTGMAVLFGMIIGGAYWYGLFHEYFLQNSYGRLNMELHVNNEYKDIDQIYKRVEIFLDDDNSIPDIDKRVFFKPLSDSEKYYNFKSLPLYLETGRYRIKIQIEDLLYWYTLYLPPRSVQKEDPLTEKGDLILLEVTDLPLSQVQVNWNVKDCFNGKSLQENTTIKILNGKEWIPFENYEKELLSGQVHQFRFENQGYFTKDYSLKIYPFQKELNIEVIMTPLAAKVEIESSVDGVKLLINGKKQVIDGSAVGHLEDIGELSEGKVQWELVPGIYLFEFSRGRKNGAIELNLESGETYTLNLDMDKEETKLLISEEKKQ